MAVAYIAAKSNTSENRRVFGSGGSGESVVVKSDDSIPATSVIAIAANYEIAQEIASALNGDA